MYMVTFVQDVLFMQTTLFLLSVRLLWIAKMVNNVCADYLCWLYDAHWDIRSNYLRSQWTSFGDRQSSEFTVMLNGSVVQCVVKIFCGYFN